MAQNVESQTWGAFNTLPEGPPRLWRPVDPVFTTFDDVWNANFGKAGPLKLRVVPLEALRPGDEQVIAAGYPQRFAGFGPAMSLDRLAEFPTVCSVVASTIVTARRPLPNVRHLILLDYTPPPDEATLRNLPYLETFFAALAGKPWPERNIKALNLEALPRETLTRLALSRYCVDGLDPLSSLVNLRDLRLVNCRRPDSIRSLGSLVKLRHLDLRNQFSGGWKALSSCSELEDVFIANLNLPDLRAFSTWTQLRRFTFAGKLKKLDGIEACSELEEFRSLVSRKPAVIDDISPLRGLRRLTTLQICIGTVLNLLPLSHCSALRNIKIFGYPQAERAGVASLEPLTECFNLEELYLFKTAVVSGDLSPLLGLPNLRRVVLELDDGSMCNAAAEFQRARPDVEVHYDGISTGAGRPLGTKVGMVTIHPPIKGIDKWYVFEDLVGVVGGTGNASVQNRVQRAVQTKDPELLDRLDFDSEADNFCVYAPTEDDIRAVAAIINELASKARGRR